MFRKRGKKYRRVRYQYIVPVRCIYTVQWGADTYGTGTVPYTISRMHLKARILGTICMTIFVEFYEDEILRFNHGEEDTSTNIFRELTVRTKNMVPGTGVFELKRSGSTITVPYLKG